MPHTITRFLVVTLAAAALAGCMVLGPTASDLPAELTFCADEVNRYRALAGRPALERSAALEAYAAQSAVVDGTANRPHLHFTETSGGGVALAETELLSWRTENVHAVIERGLELMWEEGPSGEHRVVLVGPYSQVGCGIFVSGKNVTVVQSFR